MKWSTTIRLGMTFICLSDGDWECEIIPELGGKISSIRWRGPSFWRPILANRFARLNMQPDMRNMTPVV